MESVICPYCGNEISIPDSMPKEVTCENCKSFFGVEYEAVEPLTLKERALIFARKHRKKIFAALFVASAAYKGYSWLQRLKEETTTEPDPVVLNESTNAESRSAEYDDSEATSEVDSDAYDRKVVQHDLKIRNLGQNRYPSMEKVKQAHDLGIDLGLHQTIVNPHPQRHRVKKNDT